MINTSSPLSKDFKKKPTSEKELQKFPKEKPRIPLATVKKILKPSKRIIGLAETKWLNDYIENLVIGESLPRGLLSNDIQSEIIKVFGIGKGADDFNTRILEAFAIQMPNHE